MSHVFKHPKYYKELRKLRNKTDQAISLRESETSAGERAPGSGHKLQAREDSTANSTRGQVTEPQASSGKRQAAAGGKPQAASLEKQASSPEEQASSLKP